MEYLPEADSSGSYVNETERNVHVWCSLVKPCFSERFQSKPTLGLIAGCYVHKWLPVAVFYKWIDVVLDVKDNDRGNMALFPCPDPRKYALDIGPIDAPSSIALSRRDTSNLAAGHYMLFRYGNPSCIHLRTIITNILDQKKGRFVPIWPMLVSTNFKHRSRSASQTCTPSPNSPSVAKVRDTQTRIDVRMRDKRCLITGQAAVSRARGGNFTGLEVAHIFPLMAVNIADWTQLMPQSVQYLVSTRQIADQPHNALLLRADVHSLFDDYQWSIWFEQGKPTRIVRFEKSGAAVLEPYETAEFSPSSLSGTSAPSVTLLMEHLHVALLIHVRGVGKRVVAGFNATVF